MLSSVGSASFMSCRFAPETASPTGVPLPSTSMLLFVPDLALSVGFGPVLFPPEGGFRHRRVHRLPLPVYPLRCVVLEEALLPHPLEDALPSPLLEPVVDGALPSQRAWEGLPLASRPEHVEYAVHGPPVVHPRPAPLRRLLVRRDERLDPLPERVRDLVKRVYAQALFFNSRLQWRVIDDVKDIPLSVSCGEKGLTPGCECL